MKRWCALALFGLVGVHGVCAYGAQIAVENSALEKVVKGRLFTDEGKYRLAKPHKCNHPYLETPSTEIRQGRVYLRARFAGRVGREIAGVCLSTGEPSWITVSGKPTVAGEVLILNDVKVEHVEKRAVREIAKTLIENALGPSLKLNVRELIQQHLSPASTAPYTLELSALGFQLIDADLGRLRLSVDFSLAIR
jgi:hypothetical protein